MDSINDVSNIFLVYFYINITSNYKRHTERSFNITKYHCDKYWY